MDVRAIVLVLVLCGLKTAAERESFTLPPPTCPSEKATFTCTVNDSNHYNGGRLATTFWQVGPNSTYRPCAIPHAVSGIVKECGPNNAFVARSQPPSGSYYTSILQVIAHPSLNGTSVRCYVPYGREGERTVGQGRLEVIGTPPAPSFLSVNEDDIAVLERSANVTVRWSEPQGYRNTANITSYNITANCTIPSQGSSWVETQTVHDNQKMMSFPVGMVVQMTVHADVCDKVISNESEVLELCIEVPLPVTQCSIFAVVNGSSTKIVVTWYKAEVPCHLAPGLSGNVRTYTISMNKETVEQEYICTTDSKQCSYTKNVASNKMINYTVSVAANNVIGQSDTVYCTTTSIVLEDESRPAQAIQDVVTMLSTTMLSTTTPPTGSAVNSLPAWAIVVIGVFIGVVILLPAVIGIVIYCRYYKKKPENNLPGPEQGGQKNDTSVRFSEINNNDPERSGEENVDGDGRSEAVESDDPVNQNVAQSRRFERSYSAPHGAKCEIDSSTSLLPNTVNVRDPDPSKSLPLDLLRRLGRGTGYTLLKDDQQQLLEDNSS